MKRSKNLARASVLLCASCAALAGADAVSAQVTIATVPVGNANNPSDLDNGFGTVSYAYNIGTYDVTANQYCAFLNAVATTADNYGIYHPNMAGTSNGNPGIIQTTTSSGYTYSVVAGRGNYPVTDVDFWNATRFANWLDNGQPIGQGEGVGTTETGTYNLAATQMDKDLLASSNKTTVGNNQADNNSIVRSSTASWAIISESEWYKGAYYDPAKNLPAANGGPYWDYPDQSNDSKVATVQINTGVGDTTPVGSYHAPSAIGTYDQGANTGSSNGSALFSIFNNQSTSDGDIPLKYTYYGDANLDGTVDGSDYSLLDNGWMLNLSGWYNGDFNYDGVVNGSDFTLIDNSFNTQSGRISASIAGPTVQITAEIANGSVAVPEPSTFALLGLSAVGLLRRRRHR